MIITEIATEPRLSVIIETYLGDTLKNEVFRDRRVMQRLIEQDEVLKVRKFALVDIAKEPLLIERIVREPLQGTIYHNLPKVDVLYRIAGPRSITLSGSERSALAQQRLPAI